MPSTVTGPQAGGGTQTGSNKATGSPEDWTVAAVDRIESSVAVVRDNATTRVVVAARGVVYGLIAAVLGIAVLLLVTIAAVRFLDITLSDWHILGFQNHPGRSVWVVLALLGGIFTLPGLFLLRRAATRRDKG
jgi:hypothetical protein